MPTPAAWMLREQPFCWGKRTYLMGILNVTPDSFSDGGQFNQLDRALQQASYLVQSGADILDIGGQSTRPQAETVSLQEELDRVIPVIRAIRTAQSPALKSPVLESPVLESTGFLPERSEQSSEQVPLPENLLSLGSIPISVDTTRADVACAAVTAGADLINDISGATYDPAMLSTVAELGVPIVLMHLRGTSKTMQQLTDYQDLLGEIYEFLARRIEAAVRAGVSPDRIMIDPGIGFAKTSTQNLELLRRLAQFQQLGCPMLVGTSRKSFIGHLLNQPDPQQRVWGTAATCCAAIEAGADVLRVHDVREMRDVCRVADAIWRVN